MTAQILIVIKTFNGFQRTRKLIISEYFLDISSLKNFESLNNYKDLRYDRFCNFFKKISENFSKFEALKPVVVCFRSTLKVCKACF